MSKTQHNLNGKTIVISRTDSIGDVILSLPLCAWIKEKFPQCSVIFLGKKYTRPVLECFAAIDEIKYWDDIAQQPEQSIVSEIQSWKVEAFVHVFPDKRLAKIVRKAKIPLRIGTSHRAYHLLTCNRRPNFTRRQSTLHEAQLNFKLFDVFGMESVPDLHCIQRWLTAHFNPKAGLDPARGKLLETDRKTIILHPRSQGSAVEWPMEKYAELALQLVGKYFRVFFSGTEPEGESFRDMLPAHPEIIDISGTMPLDEFIAFIDRCDGLVACSTGPLHIAAILDKKAVGLYTTIRPMHPGRWAPVGASATTITAPEKKSKAIDEIRTIAIEQVIDQLL
ncbi:MAG: glycosyltransferase family 9 protein [Bacteroidota bacterium]